MKNVRRLFAVSALIIAMAMPAIASEGQGEMMPLSLDPMADAILIFETDATPMQLAVLSPQEMRETEGARLPFRALINTWRNIKFDGPSRGLRHGDGRIFQVRYNSQPVFRFGLCT